MTTAPTSPDSNSAEPSGEGFALASPLNLEEEYADVFDCGALEVSCHITQWFHGLVLGILEPLFGWIAGMLFTTPAPTDGITGVWEGVSATVNTAYALLVIAAGFVIMTHHGLQAQYSAREVLPRLVVGFVASNVSLSVVGIAAHVSTSVAQAITADGINNEVAAQNLSERTVRFLGEDAAIVVLFLLVFVVLMILWVIVEIVRIVIVILLMVGGPAMLMFHGLPQTNRVAQMWWRSLGAVCLVPIAQALAFVALMRVFFEGDARAMFGAAQVVRGDVDLFDLFLLLVLVYVQIRIPIWAYRAVWSAPSGRSPAAGVAKALTWVAVAVVTAGTGGGAAAVRGVGGRTGALLRAGQQGVRRVRASRTAGPTTPLPRRARSWRFGTPSTRPVSTSAGHRTHRAAVPDHRPTNPETRTPGHTLPHPQHAAAPPINRQRRAPATASPDPVTDHRHGASGARPAPERPSRPNPHRQRSAASRSAQRPSDAGPQPKRSERRLPWPRRPDPSRLRFWNRRRH
ncbi:hypothetical protein ACIBFB_06410 [Nocardiopsis sp. NPDC050513]|uniref:hypothetical protein n=1 Tax=Nocardiopsis sp. NPDC050513 TaxID=3364338 RepID=UPI0037B58229